MTFNKNNNLLKNHCFNLHIKTYKFCFEKTYCNSISYRFFNSNQFVTIIPLNNNDLTTCAYSHSIVPGGFDVKSYKTLLIPLTLLIIRLEISVKFFFVNI